MSYSIYGFITCAPDADSGLEDEISGRADAADLTVQVGSGVSDMALLDEVLKAQENATSKGIPFYVLDGPASDVSHGLISPSVEGDWTKARVRIMRNLQKLQDWLMSILLINGVRQIAMYVSEDYDDDFIELSIGPNEFSRSVMAVIDGQKVKVAIPSMKVLVKQKVAM